MATSLQTDHPIQNIDLSTLQAAVEASRSPLIITDNSLPDNPIIYSNSAFEELTGYAMSEIIGKNCRFLQGKDHEQQSVKDMHASIHKGEYIRTTLKNYKKDGSVFWNDLVVSPIKNEKGQTTHFVGMQLDITDRIVANDKLEAKTHELERTNQQLEQFTYAASHDLQEPLRMISSYLQLFAKRYGDTLDGDAVEFLGFATEGADRMQTLIYDLLALSRLSTTTEKFRTVDLAKPVERALFNLKLAIDEQAAVIDVGPLPSVQGDIVQLTQLFQNLISNALKYHRKDVTPHIIISAREADGCHTIAVADNGIGIKSQYFERIFQIFQRLHTRSEYDGNGVGLSLCSKIIDRHGGKIWVESSEGSGSTFYFTVPATRKGRKNT